jgi:hypothetical protein
MYVGANAKLLSSTLETYGNSFMLPQIWVFFIDEKNDVNWASIQRNLGTQITTYS